MDRYRTSGTSRAYSLPSAFVGEGGEVLAFLERGPGPYQAVSGHGADAPHGAAVFEAGLGHEALAVEFGCRVRPNPYV